MSALLDFQEEMQSRMTNHLETLGEAIRDKIAYCIDASYNPENYGDYDPLSPEKLSYPELQPLLDETSLVAGYLAREDYEGYFHKFIGDFQPSGDDQEEGE